MRMFSIYSEYEGNVMTILLRKTFNKQYTLTSKGYLETIAMHPISRIIDEIQEAASF